MRHLIIKTGALGDIVMATALVQAICRHHQHDEVWLLTTAAFAPIFQNWPQLSVQTFEPRGARASLARLRWVRRMRFERIYDLQGNDRTSILCALSGARARIGNHNHYPYTHHPADKWRGQSHIFERMNALLHAVGVTSAAPRPCLLASNAQQAKVARTIARYHLDVGPFCILHAGASPARPEKRWPYFAQLAQRLSAGGLTVVWIGAAADAALNAELARAVGVDLSNAFDVLELAHFGRAARFAVTNDSGPMHILAAAGIPVFGLFGPSDWRRNHALGQRDHVIATSAHAGRTAARLEQLAVDVVYARLRDAQLI